MDVDFFLSIYLIRKKNKCQMTFKRLFNVHVAHDC